MKETRGRVGVKLNGQGRELVVVEADEAVVLTVQGGYAIITPQDAREIALMLANAAVFAEWNADE